MESDPKVEVLPKSAAPVGWYSPYLLVFLVCASPLARQRSAWSMVAEAAPTLPTPTKPCNFFDVTTVKNAASDETGGGVRTPKTKEGARGAIGASSAQAAAAAESAAAAAQKAADVLEAAAKRKRLRELCAALIEAVDEELDPKKKEELNERLKKAKSEHLTACETE